jgi:hypothetical protein
MSLKAKVFAVSEILSEAISPETILQKMQEASVM